MKTDVAVVMSLALCAWGAFGQVSTSGTVSTSGFRGTAHFGPPFGMQQVTGAPYSGEEVTESVQTLADGTHITRTMPGFKVYRDSQGRTRTERSMFMGPIGMRSNPPESPTIVEIIDPVAHARYVLDVQNKVAHRQELPAASPGMHAVRAIGSGVVSGSTGWIGSGGGGGGSRTSAPARVEDSTRPQMTQEKLGTQTIDGVLVDGTRHTMRWPTGAQGNDRPITSITETWTSPDLQVVILSKMTDPRSGEHTRKLINLSRSEPDPSLFQPPAGYTIVDEKSEFSINWGSPQQ